MLLFEIKQGILKFYLQPVLTMALKDTTYQGASISLHLEFKPLTAMTVNTSTQTLTTFAYSCTKTKINTV